MKIMLTISVFLILFFVQPVKAKTIEVDVHGMTCALCVDTLNRKFNNMTGVLSVQVSMKMKKIRLETDSKSPSLATIKQAVLDAGFTPVKITVLGNEK